MIFREGFKDHKFRRWESINLIKTLEKKKPLPKGLIDEKTVLLRMGH